MLKRALTVFLDMDGTLCDFDKMLYDHFPELRGVRIPDDQFWAKVCSIKGFWEDMEWTKNGKYLWLHLRYLRENVYPNSMDIQILSAPSRHDERSIPGKVRWLQRNLGSPLIRCNFVRAEYKQNFVKKGHFLIDDHPDNIEAWPPDQCFKWLTNTSTSYEAVSKLLSYRRNL